MTRCDRAREGHHHQHCASPIPKEQERNSSEHDREPEPVFLAHTPTERLEQQHCGSEENNRPENTPGPHIQNLGVRSRAPKLEKRSMVTKHRPQESLPTMKARILLRRKSECGA